MSNGNEPYRILVVEDDAINAALARRILESAGHAVLLAPDGKTAIEVLADHRVDLVLLDLVLPDRSGADVARTVRSTPGGESLPLIAVSAHFGPLDEARMSPLDFTEFLTKPLDAEALLRVVDGLLPARDEEAARAGAGRRIMIVDDDPVLRRLHSVRLRRLGFEVETVGDGNRALELCRASPPDAIVADALMPELDGFQLCLAVRRDPVLASLPFLLVSSQYLEDADRALGEKVGASDYVMRVDDNSLVDRALLAVLSSGKAPAPAEAADEIVSAHNARITRQLARQVRLNAALTARSSLQQTLLSVSAAIADALAQTKRPSEILESALARLLSSASFVAALGYLVDPAGNPSFATALGRFEREGVADLYGRLDLIEEAFAQQETLVFPGVRPDDSAADVISRFPAQTLVIVPLSSSRSESFGAVVLAVASSSLGAEMFAFLRTLRQLLLRTMSLHQTEEQLLHFQKMDAVGRLAGGVAHDFNNLLTAITGFAELLREQFLPGDGRREDLDEILKAAELGASLSTQLLAFSRRDVRSPSVVEADSRVEKLVPLLRRLLGEEILVETHLMSHSARILIDPTHLDQALINLAVNARDAMPGGGTLTIESVERELDHGDSRLLGPNQEPGRFVVLTVRDTGTGMSEAARSKAFEPFFTTKEMGQGTGLGLATVFAILQSFQGHVSFESQVGVGTSFHLVFPIVTSSDEFETTVQAEDFQGGSETILVAEDEDAVRKILCRILERQGYHTIAGADADEAIALADQEPGTIHLLITDVVMPRMKGTQLAERLRAARPGLPVLYVSGYSDRAIEESELRSKNVELLKKPFGGRDLTAAVRRLLGPSDVH